MHIYFSGIGGAGIGPLAQIAQQAGYGTEPPPQMPPDPWPDLDFGRMPE